MSNKNELTDNDLKKVVGGEYTYRDDKGNVHYSDSQDPAKAIILANSNNDSTQEVREYANACLDK